MSDIPVNDTQTEEHFKKLQENKYPILEFKSIDIQDIEIRTEMDSNETEHVPIQFNTVIPKMYWKSYMLSVSGLDTVISETSKFLLSLSSLLVN